MKDRALSARVALSGWPTEKNNSESFLSISSHELKNPLVSILNKLKSHTITRNYPKLNARKTKLKMTRLPPSKRSFNVISLTHLHIILVPTRFQLLEPSLVSFPLSHSP